MITEKERKKKEKSKEAVMLGPSLFPFFLLDIQQQPKFSTILIFV